MQRCLTSDSPVGTGVALQTLAPLATTWPILAGAAHTLALSRVVLLYMVLQFRALSGKLWPTAALATCHRALPCLVVLPVVLPPEPTMSPATSSRLPSPSGRPGLPRIWMGWVRAMRSRVV